MKSKPRLIIAAGALALAAFIVFTVTRDAAKREPPGDIPEPEIAAEDTLPNFAAPEAGLPPAPQPVLKTGGKDNRDVYLQSLDIRVEVTGNIASTRYTMVFKNRTGRTLEGELTFPLPDGRAVTHYALDVGGSMREAVPVEKARATQVFEEIQQRRVVVDPGVLERVEGNNFRTRVYPFPGHGTRTVSIGYEEELALEKNFMYYRLPMAYPDSLERFAVKASVWHGGQRPLVPDSEDEFVFDAAGEGYAAEFSRRNYRPSRALVFALPAPAGVPRAVMQPAQGSFYFLATVAPGMAARKKRWGDTLAVIWDVSLSGSQRNLQSEIGALGAIFADRKDAAVHLYFLNNRFGKVASGKTAGGEYRVAGGNWDELKAALEAAVFDGGTDFSQIDLKKVAGSEVLFFSDGISTLSDADFLKGAGLDRPVHCVVSSPKADYSAMKLVAGRTRGKFLNISAMSPERLNDELLNETPQFLGTESAGGTREVYPSVASPVPGNFSVAGISDTGEAELTLLFGFGGGVEKRIKVNLSAKGAGAGGNVYRIWAQKKIEELDLSYEANRAELTELGRQFGIVTRNTSLIVLETVDDYVRYGIAPPASEPRLLAEYRRRVRGRSQFAVLGERGASNIMGGLDMDIDAILSTYGGLRAGGNWQRGSAGIGYGAGYGSGFGGGGGNIDELLGGVMGSDAHRLDLKKRGASTTSSPEFMKGGAIIGGRTRASIQRVVMVNMRALRYEYSRRLREKPGLEGKITVKISIDEFGKVISAQGVTSTMDDPELERAVIKRITTWAFDKLDKPGDITEVTYPFVFEGGGGESRSIESISYSSPSEPRPSAPVARLPAPRPSTQFWPWGDMDVDGDRLYLAAAAARELRGWWKTDFAPPKPRYPAPDEGRGQTGKYPPPDNPAPSAGSRQDGAAREAEYMKGLTGKTADDYKAYLKLRDAHAKLPAFYFDMAEWFYRHNDRETALRVLTSIADLELESAPLYRLLGYRFKEYGEHALQKFVCRKVAQWRPIEPQSYRDYALALADNGEAQAALDTLCGLLARVYSANINRRSRGIDEVVVTEINRLLAKYPRLDASRVDTRLITDIPVDIRVVINWNMNDVDLDLHVEDPSGEEAYYGHRATRAGGRMTAGNWAGYGPEQFLLKNAAKGKYRVYVNHYGSREFAAAGPSTVMAEIYTNYAGQNEQRRVVCLQLSKGGGGARRATVAEFEI